MNLNEESKLKSYFISYEAFKQKGGSIKTTTITYEELLAVLTMHMERFDKQFSLIINGHLPKPLHEILDDAFEQSHVYKAFYTQHCANRSYRYRSLSKNRVKVDFTLSYRMNRKDEKQMLEEIESVLQDITTPNMPSLQKVIAVHDYIVRTYSYELHTKGSPFSVATFMAEKRGVCMAYALLFEKMMGVLHIPCHYVIGKADGEGDAGHAWNMVEIDGQWYHIDVTWDDIGHVLEHHEIRYRYFLLTDEQIAKNHHWDLDLYPPCTSERFNALHSLYDVCIAGDTLIYPHPKTAYLTAMDPLTLQTRKLTDIRVQYCTYANELVYLVNHSDGATLYTYDAKTAELTKCSTDPIHAIHKTTNELVVTYANGDQEMIAIETAVDVTESLQIAEFDDARYTNISMMSLGDSYLATFNSNTEDLIAFKSADGVELYINEPIRQLTVSLELNKGIQLQMTTNRKPVQFKESAKLVLPLFYIEPYIPAIEKQWDKQITVFDKSISIDVSRSLLIQIKNK
ncbi:transglutaminase domain-containing protein [Solibacillus sp. FSL K6-4121]|uniref:transglutaminase domain-containing protein n=1 Tax=Solibacillus sp. FSL K6-4121 TaxID=2921505 RepID=UPI0030F71F10